MKKLVFLALAVVMLTGCGNRNTNNNNDRTDDNASVITQEADNTGDSQTGNGGEQEPSAQNAAEDPSRDTEDGNRDFSQSETVQAFTDIELELSKCTLYIRSGDAFDISGGTGSSPDYEIKNDTLYLDNNGAKELVLELPENEIYGNLRISLNDGHLYGETALNAETLELSVKHGDAALNKITVSGSSVIDSEEGSVYLCGDLGSTLTANCNQGHFELAVPYEQEDGNYELDLYEGDIRLGNKNYHGKSQHETINNGGSHTVILNADRGDISMSFGKEEVNWDIRDHK